MIHDIILYLFFGMSYSFGMHQLNNFLNETNQHSDLRLFNWIEIVLLIVFWPVFLLIFIVSFLKS